MLSKILLISSFVLTLGATAQSLPLIPYPQEVKRLEGTLPINRSEWENFTLVHEGAPVLQTGKKTLTTERDTTLPSEAYRLAITATGIRIAYSTDAGLFYAKQTLRQLLHTHSSALPCVEITDYPLLRHRGFMIDEARHFFGKEQIKKMLDLMASYKLNRFHWHLTDDQGWRIEIPEYPLLTTKGAERKGSLINRGTSPWFYDDTPYGKGMYYTLDDLREIVAYAAQRHIEIIPEVDLPGHMVAALAAYPHLSCDTTRTYDVRLAAGVDENVLNVGDDRAIDFLKTVLSHVATVFPGKYIHIGGDECPTKMWEKNPLALQRVQTEGLTSVHDLQPWLAEQLGRFLAERYGKQIIVWDELLEHWRSESQVKPLAMAWRGVRYAQKAAEKGLTSIVVPVYPMYFDLMQVDTTRTIVEEVYQGGYGDAHVTTLPQVYAFDPLSAAQGQESSILGTQANLWTETVRNGKELEYCALPRLLALSETAWLPAKKKDWDEFEKRLQHHDELLEAGGYTYARHFFQQPVPTAADTIRHLLSTTHPAAPGYPSKRAYRALRRASERSVSAEKALRRFQLSPITLPRHGQKLQLLSASTFYKRKYAGATLYANERNARVHFTPQHTAAEIWQFLRRGKGFALRNAEGQELVLDAAGTTSFAPIGTTFFVRPATLPFKNIHYATGVVTLTDAAGRALSIAPTADVVASSDLRLTHPATWRLSVVEE